MDFCFSYMLNKAISTAVSRLQQAETLGLAWKAE
jgi:hypothetical protein